MLPFFPDFLREKNWQGRTPLPGQCQPLWELLFSPSLPESPVYKLVLQISPGLSAWITKNTNVHINYFGQCLKVTGFVGFSSSVSMNSVAQSASRWTEVVSEKPEWVILITFFSEGTLICSDIKRTEVNLVFSLTMHLMFRRSIVDDWSCGEMTSPVPCVNTAGAMHPALMGKWTQNVPGLLENFLHVSQMW